MKEITCIRCHNKRDVPDDWKFKECGKCHDRTVRRFPVIRQHEPRDFNVSTLFSFPSFEDFRKSKIFRGEQKAKIVKEYELRKADWERDNSKRLAHLDCLFAIKRYPVHSQLCVKTRIEARKHYLEGEEWDVYSVTNHMGKCDNCNDFVVALKNGNLVFDQLPDPKEEEQLRQEGYCSHKEWNDLMNEFPHGSHEEERGQYVCPVCGTPLIDGKCPRCG